MKTRALILSVLTLMATFAFAETKNPQFTIKSQDVTKVVVAFDLKGSSEISLTFGAEAQSSFAVFTKENVGQPVDLVVDGKVVASPVVTAQISGPTLKVSFGRARDALKVAEFLVTEKE